MELKILTQITCGNLRAYLSADRQSATICVQDRYLDYYEEITFFTYYDCYGFTSGFGFRLF
jgi:hypothetical protein